MTLSEAELQIVSVLENIQRQGLLIGGYDAADYTSDAFKSASAHVIQNMTGRHDAKWIEEIIVSMDLSNKSIKDSFTSALTSLENPIIFNIMTHLIKDVQHAIDTLGITVPHLIRFGTSQSGRVNGMVISVRDNPFKLIVLESGMFGFANLLAKAIAGCLPVIPDKTELRFDLSYDAVKEKLRDSPDSFLKFYQLIVAFIIFGDPHAAPPYIPSKEVALLSSIIREGLELFIVAHEYAHCIAGHLDRDDRQTRSILPESEDEVSCILTDWDDEIEADVLGAIITIQAMVIKGYDVSLALAGVSAFFAGIDIVERTVEILRKSGEECKIFENATTAHPPALFRGKILWKMLEQTRPELKSDLITAKDLHDRIIEIVSILWTPTEEILARQANDSDNSA